MNKSEQIGNLAAALVAAQAELKNPNLDSTNPHFKSKFASLANIRNTITTTFAKHGLAIAQSLSSTDRGVNCTTMIVHSSGEWMESDLVSIPATKMDAQGFGSAATYARRYSLAAFASVVGDDDDDGNEAAKPAKKELSAVRPNSAGEEFWAKAQGEEREYLQISLSQIRDLLNADTPAEASQQFYAMRDMEEQSAVWSQLGSKERAAIKQHKPEAKAA